MLLKRNKLFLLVIVILLFIKFVFAQSRKALTSEIVVSLKTVTQVAMQPQGKYVAYTLRVPREANESPGFPYSELWVVSATGGEPKQYTEKPISVSSISWSPDGQKIAFISKHSDKNEYSQVYAIQIDGGEAKLLTKSPTSISQYKWSSDGKYIVYVAPDTQTTIEKQNSKFGKDWQVVDKNYKYSRLYSLEISTKKVNSLLKKNLAVWDFEISPDGKYVLMQATDKPKTDDSYMFKKIYSVNIEGGEPVLLCETQGKLKNAAFSPDGKNVAFLSAVDINDPSSGSVFIVPFVNGSKAKNITPNYKGTAEWVGWVDNSTIAFVGLEGTKTNLNLISSTGGEIKNVTSGNYIFKSASFTSDGKMFAFAGNTLQHPNEVFIGTLKDKKITKLTKTNSVLDGISFAPQKTIKWKAQDGLEIEGVLVEPFDFQKGKRYPLILYIHGGPESAELDGWNTHVYNLSQFLADKGYFVLMPNYRGSLGRGVDFAKMDHKDLGGKEFTDVIDGIDYLVNEGFVDKDKVGIGGFSYGGYFSAWAATAYSERFAAAINGAGISNWISFLGTSDIPHENSLVHWNLYCYDNYEICWQRSPMSHINKAKTPLLIIHGEKDERVPITQAWEIYTALQIKGIPTEFVIYPREPHGILEREHQLDYIKRAIEWYDKYVKKEKI